jgi:phosphoribosylanthranilate isomerase
MSLFVKLCGLTTAGDVEVAVEAGADAIGLVMTDSPRQLSLAQAAALRAMLPRELLAVAVFHSPSRDLLERVRDEVDPDLFQATPDALGGLEGSRTMPVVVDGPDFESRAASVLAQTGSARFLLDNASKGGTGQRVDWSRLAGTTFASQMVLAGGLRPGNVAEALRLVRPGGVDVSSGVERAPGVKDHALMKEFVRAARSVDVGGGVTV